MLPVAEVGEWIPFTEWRRLPDVCGVYIIRNRNSLKEYVGKSLNVRNRVSQHNRKDRDSYLHNAIRKHGDNNFEVCCYMVGTEIEALELEVLVIEERGTHLRGYNLSLGGDGVIGHQVSVQTREKIRKAATGKSPSTEARRRASVSGKLAQAHRVGIPVGPELSQVISIAVKAGIAKAGYKKWTPESLAKRSATNTGRKLKKASDSSRLKRSLRLKGSLNPQYGKFGIYHPATKGVAVWEPGSMLPKTFTSRGDAASWAGVRRETISAWCKGQNSPSNGRVWCFL